MWRDYSKEFIRRNRASSISIRIAAFISALFLSLICGLSYNLWVYEVERITMEEGSWQGRISGINENDLSVMENFANVEKAEINTVLSEEGSLTADVWFQDAGRIYEDMPRLAEKLGVEERGISYHELLLSRYLIHDPQDPNPPLLLSFFLVLLLAVSVSLILIIHNSFAVSMQARVHQFGIFSSIGAAPGQIFACVMQEAGALCVAPVFLGSGLGIAGSAGIIGLINFLAKGVSGRHPAVFRYHPLVFAATILAAVLTVFFSAYLPARKLSRLTPLQAIRGAGEASLKKKKCSRILSLLFGVEGELAGNALKAQKKALRTSNLSLTLSFLSFTVMLCFFTLSGISVNHTYFERYQDVWDVMVTLKDRSMEEFTRGEEIRNLPGVRSSVIYQKAEAVCLLPESGISEELRSLGVQEVAEEAIAAQEGAYVAKAPMVILDDRGFEEYCRQIGAAPETTGSIVLNQIWDSTSSNFRYRKYLPFVKEELDTITLQNAGQPEHTVEIPVLAYTQEEPVLREEYDNYALVQILPLSLWKQIAEPFSKREEDTYIRVLGREEITLEELNGLQKQIAKTMDPKEEAEIENRIQDQRSDQEMKDGMMMIFGAFCVLLAVIGIANVFSNTLGFLRQRKREFARYASIGMTPESMRKMFIVEALVLAGRPLIITLPLTAAVVAFMINASYLDPVEFLVKAPLVPILAFMTGIFLFVGLAYYIGGKRVLNCDLAETLQSDNMV